MASGFTGGSSSKLLYVSTGEITSSDFGPAYRARFGKNEGDSLSIRVRRGSQTLTLSGRVRLGTRVESRLEADGGASEKAARIRSGLLRGTVDR